MTEDPSEDTSGEERHLRAVPSRAEEVATVEGVWERFGTEVRAKTRLRLGADADLVDAACGEILVGVAQLLADADPLPSLEEMRGPVGRLVVAVCNRVGREGTGPAMARGNPVEAVPEWIRHTVLIRADRQAEEARLAAQAADGAPVDEASRFHLALRALIERYRRGLEAAVLLPRFIRDTLDRGRRAIRDAGRRVDTAVTSSLGASGAETVATLTSAGGLAAQAAAAVTVALALGVAGTTTPERVPGPALASVARPALTAAEPQPTQSSPSATARQDAVETAAVGSAVVSPPTQPTSAQVPMADPETVPGAPISPPTVSPVQPEVRTNASEVVSEPVHEEERQGGARLTTSSSRVSVDGDGDGADETSIGLPSVVADCPRPEERGAVTGLVCPVTEGASP